MLAQKAEAGRSRSLSRAPRRDAVVNHVNASGLEHMSPFHGAIDKLLHHGHDSPSQDPSSSSHNPVQSTSSHHHSSPDRQHPDRHVDDVHHSDTHPIDPLTMTSLTQSIRELSAQSFGTAARMVRSSEQFERLVAGFESESGEAPPAYERVVAMSGSGSARSSSSMRSWGRSVNGVGGTTSLLTESALSGAGSRSSGSGEEGSGASL